MGVKTADLSADDDVDAYYNRFSIGGLKYIIGSRHRYERAFWLVFVAAGTVFVSYLLYSTIKEITDHPVQSVLDDSFSLSKVPFPSVTVCKTRPGLEQYGLVEAALNWIDPKDPAVNGSVAAVEGFASYFFPFSADAIAAAGLGTKLVAFLSLDKTEEDMSQNTGAKFAALVAAVKGLVDEVMDPLLGSEADPDLKFLDVNAFFTETANNWYLVNPSSFDQKTARHGTLYTNCLESNDTLKPKDILCGANSTVSTPECAKYCKAYDYVLRDRQLQESLLEHAISPATVFTSEFKSNKNKNKKQKQKKQQNKIKNQKPWYVAKLAEKYSVLSSPPGEYYDPRFKAFSKVTKCYYAKKELGKNASKNSAGKAYKACSDFQQTVTDIGVCATYHASRAISLWPGMGHKRAWRRTRGTGVLPGLTAVFSGNLMAWQRDLAEPILMRVHSADSFATFIPGDFTDVDREAVEVPVMYQSDVALSAKVVDTAQSFKDLSADVRKCHLKGVDNKNLSLLAWADQTLDNCMLDCKFSTAASHCGCVPWYLRFKHQALEQPPCELSGHLCFMRQMKGFTDWGAEDDYSDGEKMRDAGLDDYYDEEEENGDTIKDKFERNPCGCLPTCDQYSYYSRLAKTSAQKLRHEKYRWMATVPRQHESNPCWERFTGRLAEINCDPKLGLFKQRLGDFFHGNGTTRWEKETAAVNVYFDRAQQLATVRSATPLSSAMSQIGGTLGLYTQFTGWSFIILMQLIFLVIESALSCLHYNRAKRNRNRKIKA